MSMTGHTLVKDSLLSKRGTMSAALHGIANRNHSIRTIIDIGASDGRWSENAMTVFPSASYLLIEAQALHETGLSKFCKQHQSSEYVIAAAGARRGMVYFDASDPFSGVASNVPFPEGNIELPVTSVDDEVSERGLTGPFLIKFDTHGFELPILKGAESTLKNTSVIIMECYNYKLSDDCLLFYEMCRHMETLGFRCIDMADPLYRPYDDTFWQMDLVFVRNDRPEFNYVKYT